MTRSKRPVATLAATLVAVLVGSALNRAATAAPLFVPVHTTDFPDPFVIGHAGEFIAYSTNSRGINLPVATSRDLVNWTTADDPAKPGKQLDAMPVLAPWVREGHTWAPEVMRVGERWLLYYTARHARRGHQCLGVAAAAGPKGPFVVASAEPLVCQDALGGTIDAHPFRDTDGQLYLYYKNDGNNPRVLKPASIFGQRLAADGLSVTGEPVKLVTNDKHWEWRVVEAPAMVAEGGRHTLFFSANHYGWEADQRLSNYGIGYATCSGPLGPCLDAPENPWIHSFREAEAGCLSGPGHPTVFSTGRQRFIAFHAWAATSGCRKADDKRYLYVAPLFFRDAKPVVGISLRPAPKR